MKKPALVLVIALLSAGCSKDKAEPELSIDAKSLEINYDKQHQFALTKGQVGLDPTYFTWKSSDEKVASISTTGKLSGRKIGATTITAISEGKTYSCYVTVLPYVTTFEEPFLEFGADKSTVKSKVMKLLEEETDDFLVYPGLATGLEKVIYTFKDNKMNGVVLDFSETESVRKNATTYIKERYPLTAIVAKDTAYVNDAKTAIVFLNTIGSLGFNASYGQILHEGGRLGAVNFQGKSFSIRK